PADQRGTTALDFLPVQAQVAEVLLHIANVINLVPTHTGKPDVVVPDLGDRLNELVRVPEVGAGNIGTVPVDDGPVVGDVADQPVLRHQGPRRPGQVAANTAQVGLPQSLIPAAVVAVRPLVVAEQRIVVATAVSEPGRDAQPPIGRAVI